ncbi:MAG TPA: hypothetical protein PKL62_17160, partial [Accumulibacter sp.]|uniref:hypothetical protein n=1 Tax=Accumulibacter sp. TaxID=2053492 RepID=UPI002BDD941E
RLRVPWISSPSLARSAKHCSLGDERCAAAADHALAAFEVLPALRRTRQPGPRNPTASRQQRSSNAPLNCPHQP